MKLVLLGPPGAGKGTQADLLAAGLGVPKISTGDLFRAHVSSETTLGLLAKSHLAAGTLVPDEVTVGMVIARLADADTQPGFILDGFPRTITQARTLDEMLARDGRRLDAVLEFQVDIAEVTQRMSGRRTCHACAAVWHLIHRPPTDGRCGTCGGELYQRADDEPATIAHRLRVYATQTAPLADHYRTCGILTQIDAAGTVEQVSRRALTALTPALS